MRLARPVLVPLVASLVLALSGCPDDGEECTGPDCGSACSPACSGSSPVCDKNTNTCKTCTPEEGCAEGKVCDTTVSKGKCVACMNDTHCDAQTPICDSVTQTCVLCTSSQGCAGGEICDLSVPGGLCVTDGCWSNTDCSGTTPVCDIARRQCVTCTALQGCPQGYFCNTTVLGGQCQMQTGCASSAQCSGTTPVCDTNAGVCVVCNASEGCGANEACNTTVPGGQCVSSGCTSNLQCAGATPICDTNSGDCVVCTATQGCGATETCDTSVPGGRCEASVCTSNLQCAGATPICDTNSGDCVVCTATQGCATGQLCDTSSALGQCVNQAACTSSPQCSAPTPVCDTVAQQCVVCTAAEGCAVGESCDLTVSGGQCVAQGGCTSSTQCSGATPVCNTSTRACVVCTAAEGCGTGESCDLSVAGGQCVSAGCTDSLQCSAPTPICQVATGECVVCTATQGCLAGQTCELSVPGGRCVTVGDAAAQIAAVRAAAPTDGTDATGLSLPIQGALVSYLKPAVGSDAAGFILQAALNGPAIFIQVAPTTLSPNPAVGDSVNLVVNGVRKATGSLTAVFEISGFTRVSAGNPITSLAQELSGAADLVDNLEAYEFELLRISGVITGSFGPGGTDHSSAQFSTSGVQGNDNLKLRLPTTLREDLALDEGCSVTVNYGPMWRWNTQAQPSAYAASELTGVSCPAPALVSAKARTANEVALTFSRAIDPTSVLANGSQFGFSGGLSATGAVVSNKVIYVSTTSQIQGAPYTVTAARTLTDLRGVALSAQNVSSFSGFIPSTYDLIISEYVEGSSNNKAIEIYKFGAGIADLSTCSIKLYSNGSLTASTVGLPAHVLQAGETFVVCHGLAQGITCDATSNSLTFNGNDAIELVCDGTTVDVVGQIGFSPAGGWTDGIISTENMSLRRKCNVFAGDAEGSDAFQVELEWESTGVLDDFSGVGSHCP